MAEQIQWLPDVHHGHWARLGAVARAGLAVPAGFVVVRECIEEHIRAAYEELKIREYTDYLAVRSPSRAQLDVIGSDALIHTLRGSWSQSPDDEILIQSMVNSLWCGEATAEGRNLRIRASEGLICLDPDTYLFNRTTRKCTRRTLYQHPRKVFRAVDGRTRTMEVSGERRPLPLQYMEAIDNLAARVETGISWILDDRRVWLISVRKADA